MNNGFYTSEISDYEKNFQQAITNIEKIQAKLDNLSASFSGSSGEDIDQILADIKLANDKLLKMKNDIESARNKTVSRAASCDRCYNKYYNMEYPSYETDERSYGYGASVWIGNDGLIHIAREYSEKQDFLEAIASIFVSHAGELFDEYTISKEEMFNS